MNESISFLNEAVHHKVCIQYQTKYNNLLEQIRTIKWDIEVCNATVAAQQESIDIW